MPYSSENCELAHPPRRNRHAGTLTYENRRYAGSGGVSQENRSIGFVPAFLDGLSGKIYRSRFANGSPSPIHILEGLPAYLLMAQPAGQRVTARPRVVSGFLRDGRFYTRDEAAAELQAQSIT